MCTDRDGFWDELGILWRASVQDVGFISSRLEARLRLQSALLTAGTIAGAALGVVGFGLAAWAIWVGASSQAWNFLTRGVTLAIVSVLAVMTSLGLRQREESTTGSLREMLQAYVARSERLIRAADLGSYSLVILAIGGMLGYGLRVRLGRPPAVSPIQNLLLLALVGSALVWYRRTQARVLRKYRHLSEVFGSEDNRQ